MMPHKRAPQLAPFQILPLVPFGPIGPVPPPSTTRRTTPAAAPRTPRRRYSTVTAAQGSPNGACGQHERHHSERGGAAGPAAVTHKSVRAWARATMRNATIEAPLTKPRHAAQSGQCNGAHPHVVLPGNGRSSDRHGQDHCLPCNQNGKISATKDEHGRWQVDPAELHRVYPPNAPRNGGNDATQRDAIADVELQLKVLLAEHRLSDLKDALEDMRCQRDAWQTQAERLAITDQRQRQRSWWRRLASEAASLGSVRKPRLPPTSLRPQGPAAPPERPALAGRPERRQNPFDLVDDVMRLAAAASR